MIGIENFFTMVLFVYFVYCTIKISQCWLIDTEGIFIFTIMRRYGKLPAPGWLSGHASSLFLQSFKHNTHLGVRLYFDFSSKRKETLGLHLETKHSSQISVASKNQQDVFLHLKLKKPWINSSVSFKGTHSKWSRTFASLHFFTVSCNVK